MAKQIESNESSHGRHHPKYVNLICLYWEQLNSNKKPSKRDYLSEFLGNVFSNDTKIFRPLTVLFLRSGTITRRYIKGKPVSYTNPFRFLLSVAIVYFILIGFGSNFEQLNRFGEDGQSGFMKLDASLIENFDFGEAEQNKNELFYNRILQI